MQRVLCARDRPIRNVRCPRGYDVGKWVICQGNECIRRHRKAAMAPAQELAAQSLGNDTFPDEEAEHRAPKTLHEQPLRDRRQQHERPVRTEGSVGGKDVHVRVEVRQIPEGLHEQDQAQAGAGKRRGVRIDEQSSGDTTQLTEPCSMLGEDISPCPYKENARRGAPALLPVHRAWRWIVMRTAVNFASGASVTGRLQDDRHQQKTPALSRARGFL